MLSAKELNYIKDFLSWELLMAKKCNEYANQEVDPNFKGVFHNAGQTHQQNYRSLLSYLQQQSSQGGMVQ
ncbi:MAG: hypothetical protein AWM53_01431 [Candidatus Dichloromethanomonas elyunquensis]|nr:MAG: hypothetical protein AWM53_01431 [Candidatus Dichloromethanomonas elyunquensis]